MTANNRVALVTGGARGIGAAICAELARTGHHVAVNYRGRATEAARLVATIEREGGTAMAGSTFSGSRPQSWG